MGVSSLAVMANSLLLQFERPPALQQPKAQQQRQAAQQEAAQQQAKQPATGSGNGTTGSHVAPA